MEGYISAYYRPLTGCRLGGKIYEDNVHSDGTNIHTSHVTVIVVDKIVGFIESGSVLTNSGSRYEYVYNALNPERCLAPSETVYERRTYK